MATLEFPGKPGNKITIPDDSLDFYLSNGWKPVGSVNTKTKSRPHRFEAKPTEKDTDVVTESGETDTVPALIDTGTVNTD